jgi:hypothetical protein
MVPCKGGRKGLLTTSCDHRNNCNECKRSWKAMDDIIKHYRRECRALEEKMNKKYGQ